jgi:hypothetical protein
MGLDSLSGEKSIKAGGFFDSDGALSTSLIKSFLFSALVFRTLFSLGDMSSSFYSIFNWLFCESTTRSSLFLAVTYVELPLVIALPCKVSAVWPGVTKSFDYFRRADMPPLS